MSKSTPATDLIRETLARMPDVATKTLARKLYSEQPELWATQEACRKSILRIRGANGKRDRKRYSKIPLQTRTKGDSERCRQWGALLPDPEPSEFRWVELPEKPTRWLILSDVHVPYHSEALATALAHAENNCDGVLLLGDVADAYQLSYWERDPRKRRFIEEIEAVKQFLDAIAKLAPTIVWKAGNHEARLERYLMQKAPELFDVPQFSWRSFCDLDERGIQWVEPHEPISHHALSLIHGHEWGNRFSSPVNPARGAFLKAHDCTLEGHCHRTSHHTEHTLRERAISCWSLGCLCNLHPLYRPLGNKWNHGFAYLNAGPHWSIENHRIVKGEVK